MMTHKPRRRRLGVLGAVLGLAFLAPVSLAPAQTATDPVTVFAAASLKNALDDVGHAYAAKTGHSARFSYAASSAIARQIEAGAPADVFVSADNDWMDYLAQRRLIVQATRRDVLTNHLALIAPADSTVKLRIARGMPLAKVLGTGRLAVAGPDVPAGRYGKAALTALGVWPSVQDRLAPAENVRGALAFVARGEAPLGIVYDTDAKVEPKVRIVGLFPEATHPKIVYPAAVVARSANPEAGEFLGFLQGPEAGAIFRRYGFIVLARPE
ncbi:MAG: molybdate ABC transporter substrate-binding protein [Caulobacteraceae bacterium]|nr:molybdate ABC transporter substrate-binding protein [Caulobacteraceae bacterium]